MNSQLDACQDLQDELDRIDAAVRLARRKLRRANPSDKVKLIAELNTLLEDENVTGLALFECRERNPTLLSISIDPFGACIPSGTVLQFVAIAHLSNGDRRPTAVTWISSDTTIATVNNQGQARGLRQGTTAISASDAVGNLFSQVTLSVGVASIAVSPLQVQIIYPGSAQAGVNTQQFTALGTFADGSTGDVTTCILWNVANPALATISNFLGSQGRATGVSQGTTIITAATRNTGGLVVHGEARLTVE